MNPTLPKVFNSGDVLPTPGTPEYAAAQGSLVDRYNTKTNTEADNIAAMNPAARNALSEANMQLGIGNPLREQYRANAQGTIDAIRSQFDKYINEDTDAKKALETKAYLSALAGGRAFSPLGATETTKAADVGQKKVRQDIMDREGLIQKAYSEADLRASTEYDQRRKEYLANEKDAATAEKNLNDKVKTSAEGELAAYAQNRTYDDWAKEAGPAKVQQYMKETGRDEMGLKALFLKNMKNDLVSSDGTKNADGSVSFYKKVYDESGNLTGVKEAAKITGAATGKTIKDARLTDNGVQILYTDGTYEQTGTPGNNSKSGNGTGDNGEKPITGTPTGFTTADIEQGRKIFQQFGKGGYAEPAFYIDAYQTWINKGGKASKFLEIYPPDEFVNPTEASLLPTYLQPSKKVTKPATTTTTDTTPSTSGRTY